jgi:hypothetical protein
VKFIGMNGQGFQEGHESGKGHWGERSRGDVRKIAGKMDGRGAETGNSEDEDQLCPPKANWEKEGNKDNAGRWTAAKIRKRKEVTYEDEDQFCFRGHLSGEGHWEEWSRGNEKNNGEEEKQVCERLRLFTEI